MHMQGRANGRSATQRVHVVCWAGAFAGSWLGGLALQLGEWIIKKLPLVKHIYSAAKQVRLACLALPAMHLLRAFNQVLGAFNQATRLDLVDLARI